jgi:hypothetical protein
MLVAPLTPPTSSTAPSTVAAITPMPAVCWRVARCAPWRAVTWPISWPITPARSASLSR